MARKKVRKVARKKRLTPKKIAELIAKHKKAIARLKSPLRRKQKAKHIAKMRKQRKSQNKAFIQMQEVLKNVKKRLKQPQQLRTMGLKKALPPRTRISRNADGSVDGEVRIKLSRRVSFDYVLMALQDSSPNIKKARWRAGFSMHVPPEKLANYHQSHGMARIVSNWQTTARTHIAEGLLKLDTKEKKITHWPGGSRRKGYKKPEEVFFQYRFNAATPPRNPRKKRPKKH